MGYRNLLTVTAKASGAAGGTVDVGVGEQTLRGTAVGPITAGTQVVAAVRPDDVQTGPAGGAGLSAMVEVVEYQGRELAMEARTPDGIRLHLRTQQRLVPGDPVTLSISTERLLVFPADDFPVDQGLAATPALAGSGTASARTGAGG
jgi:putative spermidine/putrescine transport system ATP-binding protein